jgi:ATP/maltotriose-dependent transcriptional regulator MalT
MSVLSDTSTLPSRIGVPSVPLWAVPRTRLAKRLDAAAGLLTMISAPTGAGKTVGVASWARDLHPSVGVIWVKPRGSDSLPLDQISAELALRSRAVLVCDDFPAEPSAPLIQDLEVLLAEPDRRLGIILICSTSLMVPVHLLNPRDLVTINFDDLVMDEKEVKLVLDQHGAKASETTIRAVLEHTGGWAAGVGLAATALAQLSRSIPSDVQQASAARAAVRSLTVLRILAGAGGEVVQDVIESEEFGETKPLLLAAAALAKSWVDTAESALARATLELSQAHEPEIADLLSLALLNMAMSRQRGDAATGLAQASHIKDLMIKLPISQRVQAPELLPLIDYYVAGFELLRGNVDTARRTLERKAGRVHQSRYGDANHAEQLARANCTGLLSWIDAICGDLRTATRYATSLLTDRQADSGEIGVKFAHLATAWTHMERGEVEQARQRLDHAQNTSADSFDPLLAAAQRLTQVRLALVTDEPETALRLLQSTETGDCHVRNGWFADQFLVATAEAWVAAGEPQRAIATLTPEPDLAVVEARLLLARALRLVGGAQDSGLSRQHATFLASVPEPITAALGHRRSDDHVYGSMIVVPLTTRETDVLRLLAEHCSNEEIAADLVLSLNTVKTHMRSLFQKLSVSRRADAVRRGRALGLC